MRLKNGPDADLLFIYADGHQPHPVHHRQNGVLVTCVGDRIAWLAAELEQRSGLLQSLERADQQGDGTLHLPFGHLELMSWATKTPQSVRCSDAGADKLGHVLRVIEVCHQCWLWPVLDAAPSAI